METIKQWWRVRQAQRGKATWGRLPDPPTGRVNSPIKATMSIEVTRADGTVEHFGEVPATVTAYGNGSN